MISDPTPHPLTTVLSVDQRVVHVSGIGAVSSLVLGERFTLCRRPVVCPVSAQAFHRHGCPECADEAVRNGVVSIADHRRTTVNLPRFLAAFRSRDATSSDALLPVQRDAVES